MMWFKQRNELGKEVEKWMADNNAANTPLATISYLVIKGWLKERPIECKDCIHCKEIEASTDDVSYRCAVWGSATISDGYCHLGHRRERREE